MDEPQHYARFDADNDFEGGQWVGGEFYAVGVKRGRTQTKEEQLYGVFLESDSEEERGRGQKPKADYSRPVAFRSTGEVVGSAKHEGSEVRPPGLGFAKAEVASQQQAARQDDDEDARDVLPGAFGARIQARADKRREDKKKQQVQEKQRQVAKAADPEFATFEKHTKGLGMKLLMKMGYKPGEGLGRDKSGIAKPVEVQLRPKNMGMGFGARRGPDPEDSQPAPVQGPQTAADQKAAIAQQGKLWKKKHSEARVKREYRSADQVLQEAPTKPLAAQPILDMRGPQTRLITNMDHLNMKDGGVGDSAVPMPELQHNLQLLVDLAEADIQKLDAKLRHEQDTATLLAREEKLLQEQVTRQEDQLQRLTTVLEEVDRCTSAGPSTMSLDEVEAAFTHLARHYREEYILYNLAAPALAAILPRLAELLHGWAPLIDPKRGAVEFGRLRPLLEPGSAGYGQAGGAATRGSLFAGTALDGSGSDPYLWLVSELVLPPMRAACTSWQPRDPEPLLAWLDVWASLLPRAALDHVLDMLVMPRLQQAVLSWEPRQETVAIHTWLHPWLEHLAGPLQQLYPGIRHKLYVALQAWHPSDGSALVLLAPWKNALSPLDWSDLLLRSITPKLAAALAGFQVNPLAQDMAPFEWVMAWTDCLPEPQMVSLLEGGFFPQWKQVLAFWLSHQPDYDEVTRWYLGWKAAFPPSVMALERVRAHFTEALDMMNQAVDGRAGLSGSGAGLGPGVSDGPSAAFTSRWANDGSAAGVAAASQAPAAAAAHAAMMFGHEPTLKEMVQHYAEQHSIQFLPRPGRVQDGMQVYAFGSTSVVLDNTQNVIRALLRDRWAPVSLETLRVMQNNR
ncbi:TFP11-domain-containing protein [Haematococcus lacustris]